MNINTLIQGPSLAYCYNNTTYILIGITSITLGLFFDRIFNLIKYQCLSHSNEYINSVYLIVILGIFIGYILRIKSGMN